MHRWFIVRDGKETGPISALRLKEMALLGELDRTDLVRRNDLAASEPAVDIEGLLPWWYVVPEAAQLGPFTLEQLVAPPLFDSGGAGGSGLVGIDDLVRRTDWTEWREVATVRALDRLFDNGVAEEDAEKLGRDSLWYVLPTEEKGDCYTADEIADLLRTGKIKPDDFVQTPDCDWKPAHTVPFFDKAQLLAASESYAVIQKVKEETAALESRAAIIDRSVSLAAHSGDILCLAFSTDSTLLFSGGRDAMIRQWDVATGRQANWFEGHSDAVLDVSVSGNELASCSRDRTIRLWDARTNKERRCLTGHDGPVNSVAFLPDGVALVSGGDDGTLRYWDRKAGQEMKRIVAKGRILCLCPSPTGSQVFAAVPPRLLCWDLQTGEMVFGDTPRRAPGINSIAVSHDLAHVAAVGTTMSPSESHVQQMAREDAEDGNGTRFHLFTYFGNISVWDAAEGALPVQSRHWVGHREKVWAVAFSPDGKSLASASSDGTVKLWDVVRQDLLCTFRGHEADVCAMAFSPNGHWLASGGRDCRVRLWDLAKVSPKLG
jgi:WD40 repeat protein